MSTRSQFGIVGSFITSKGNQDKGEFIGFNFSDDFEIDDQGQVCGIKLKSSAYPKPEAASQPVWYINALTGNDSHSGATPAKALKTWAEYSKRLGCCAVLVGAANTDPPPVFSHTQTVVNLLTDLPASDPIDFDITLQNKGLLAIIGTPKTVYTGVLTAVTPLNRGANQAWEITDASIGSWAPYVGKKIRITAGPNAGLCMYVAKDLGGTSARISAPLDNGSGAASLMFVIPSPGVVLAGDPYVIEEMTSVYTRKMIASAQRNEGPLFAGSLIGFQNLAFQSLVYIEGTATPNFVQCSFAQTMAGLPSHRQLFLNNCIITNPGVGFGTQYGSSFLFGGLSLESSIAAFLANITFDFDFLFQGGYGLSVVASAAIGAAGFFDGADAAIDCAGIFVPYGVGRLWFIEGFSGVAALYGKDNAVGVRVNVGGSFVYGASYGSMALPSLTSLSGDFLLAGAATGRSWDEGLGAYTTPIPCTWANVALPIGGGGFGGSAHNVQLGAAVYNGASLI
jgi:hypothetical protein